MTYLYAISPGLEAACLGFSAGIVLAAITFAGIKVFGHRYKF